MAMALMLVLPTGGFASKTQWEAVDANRVWNHDTYRVSELKLPPIVDGPFNLGDNVLVQTTARTCAHPDCGERDAFILRNGSAIHVPNVPKGVLDLDLYIANEGRVVWAAQKPFDENRFAVVELDLLSGEKITLADDIFIDGVESIKVMVAGDQIFLNPTFDYDEPNRVFKHAVVFRYSPARDGVELITKRYHSQNEELLDVDLENGRILTKMTFPNGAKELHITKLESSFHPYGEADRIVGTYTPKHEDIVGAHFRADGAVEYFRFWTRSLSTTDNGVDTIHTASLEENLNWLRPEGSSIFLNGESMVYVNMNGDLTISNTQHGVIRPANVGMNTVTVNEDQVFYVSANGIGYVYDLNDGTTVSVDHRPVDKFEDAVVGVDVRGSILYTNTSVDATIDLGFGTDPAMSDNRHVYWRGVNGSVFEATIASNPDRLGNFQVEAVKIEGSPVVFLVDGINRWTLDSESAYFSWFKSWDDVKTVSPAYITRFRDRGPAAYAPGSRIKSTTDARVYVIASDNTLHWIVNQEVADAIYGPSWNDGIIDVSNNTLVSYRIGSTIDEVEDLHQI